jgi:PncC family amidohydrolase
MTFHDIVQKNIDILKKHNLTISICESVTGGMIISHMVDIPGASKVIRGGIVSYVNEVKTNCVGVRKHIIEKYGVISKEAANEMAIGIANKMKTDIALAITGNAGPKAIEQKDVGLAYLSVKVIDKLFTYEIISKEKNRNDIRIDMTAQAIILLHDVLIKMDK